MRAVVLLALLLAPALAHAATGTAEVWYAEMRSGPARVETYVQPDAGPRRRVALPRDVQHGDRVYIAPDGQVSPLMTRGARGIMPPVATGVHRVAILIAHYADEQHPMDGAAGIAAELLQFFKSGSYGALTMKVDLLGPYTIATKAGGCDYRTIGNQTQAIAVGVGVDLSVYTHKIYAFPYSPACPWFGYATGGTPSTSYIMGGLAHTLYAHELGHNLGLPHAHSMTPAGVTSDSGDSGDTMGSGWGQPYNAIAKAKLGWLTPRVVTASGTYALTALDTTPSALRIEPQAGGDVLSVVLRYPSSFRGVPGIIIHRHRGGGSYLTDVSGGDSFADSALLAGQAWKDPASGVEVAVLAVSTTAASVKVTVPTVVPPVTPPVPPATLADVSRTCTRAGGRAEFCVVDAGEYRCTRQTGGVSRVGIERAGLSVWARVPNPKVGATYAVRCQVTATAAILSYDGVERLTVNR